MAIGEGKASGPVDRIGSRGSAQRSDVDGAQAFLSPTATAITSSGLSACADAQISGYIDLEREMWGARSQL